MNETQLKLMVLAILAPLLILFVELRANKDRKAAKEAAVSRKQRMMIYAAAFGLANLADRSRIAHIIVHG